MPCYTEPYSTAELNLTGRLTTAQTQAVLCGVFSAMSSGDLNFVLDKVDWSEVGISRSLVQQWWSRHQEDDRQRRQLERVAAKKKEAEERAELARLKAKYGDSND